MKDQLIKWLGRKTNSTSFIPEIDGFRFFAIFTVLIYHLNTNVSRVIATRQLPVDFAHDWVYRWSLEGGIGVSVFFAISGFILAVPFARHHLSGASPVNLSGYYRRRLTRLEPPYIISLLVFFFAHVVLLHEHFGDIFPNLLASIFYIHNITFDQWSLINPVSWSLEVEVQFYILAPALASLFAIKNTNLRRGILLVILLISLVHYNVNYKMIEALHLRKSIFMHLHQFMVGFLFAEVYLTMWKEKVPEQNRWFDVLALGCFIVLFVFNEPFNFLDDVLFVTALTLIFVSLFRGPLINAFFTNQWIVITGGMCYTIYLIHYGMIAFLTDHSIGLVWLGGNYAVNLLIQGVVILPIVLMVSAVYFSLIERPCMDKDWPAKLLSWFRHRQVR